MAFDLRVEDDAVAALSLGFVERGVGGFEQVAFEAGLLREQGHADADGDVLGLSLGGSR